MKKTFLLKVLALIFTLCFLTCAFSACKEDNTPDCEALTHEFNNNVCEKCGLEVTSNEYFEFTLLDDNTYAIKPKDAKNLPQDVVIPPVYNGKAVTKIDDGAFSSSNLNSLKITEGITEIGQAAFVLAKIKSLELPQSIQIVGYLAFFSESIPYTEKDGLKYYGNKKNPYLYLIGTTSGDIIEAKIHRNCKIIGDNAFPHCDELISVRFPKGITNIGSRAFYMCGNLASEIEIPNCIIIEEYAFYGCGSIPSVELGEGLTSIGGYAFANCLKLTSIEIPDTVTELENAVFSQCQNLASVKLSKNLNSIPRSTFAGCYSLKSIVISKEVQTVLSGAFDGCSSLTIYCESKTQPEGWAEDWNPDNRPVVWGYES